MGYWNYYPLWIALSYLLAQPKLLVGLVPGYGLSAGTGSGPNLSGFAVEIPGTNEQRVVVYEQTGDRLRLRDDFATSELSIHHTTFEGGRMQYRDIHDQVVLERAPSHPK